MPSTPSATANPQGLVNHLTDCNLLLLLLCRWASLGAFYPFSRNHYAYFTRSHEYYQWPDVAAAAKKAYTLRYQLLSYIYSSFFLAHVKGGTVARPLLFTDPSDIDAR
jgi:alpha-glucosidase (family GH31 glycosyl hydrolase)